MSWISVPQALCQSFRRLDANDNTEIASTVADSGEAYQCRQIPMKVNMSRRRNVSLLNILGNSSA